MVDILEGFVTAKKDEERIFLSGPAEPESGGLGVGEGG